jgi:hypothetical protein
MNGTNVTNEQAPAAAFVIGRERQETIGLDEVERRYRFLARETVALEDEIVKARAQAEASHEAAVRARIQAATDRQRIAELERKLTETMEALRLAVPPARPAPPPPPPDDPPAKNLREVIAAAHGFESPRAMLRQQYLNALPASARSAIEANEPELARALDLANLGLFADAYAVAIVLVATAAKETSSTAASGDGAASATPTMAPAEGNTPEAVPVVDATAPRQPTSRGARAR